MTFKKVIQNFRCKRLTTGHSEIFKPGSTTPKFQTGLTCSNHFRFSQNSRLVLVLMRFHFCILFFSLFAYLENTRERKLLEQCLTLAREILSYIDRQVDAREKEQRLFDIYNKLDARSYAMLNGKKFKVNIFYC